MTLEAAQESHKFRDETTGAGYTHGTKAGNGENNSYHRNLTCQSTQFGDITLVGIVHDQSGSGKQ